MRYSLPLVLLLAGCGSPSPAPSSTSAEGADLTAAPVLTFAGDFTQSVTGTPVAGGRVKVAYDAARLVTCRDSSGGNPLWAITGYASVNGLPPAAFPVAGLMPAGGSKTPSFVPPVAGDLQLWFENTDASGCNAWDSAYGQNYHFQVTAPASAPDWVGEATSVLDRDSCSGQPCSPGVVHPLGAGFTFDTLARQQDGFARAFFQVWKPGVTDFDNPLLGQELTVTLHSRTGGLPRVASAPIAFYQRLGNNAQYSVDLRQVDPLADPGGKLTRKSQCPAFPLTLSADGQYVEVGYDFYMTVNGVAVQPGGGGMFHGVFSNYAGLYAICLGG